MKALIPTIMRNLDKDILFFDCAVDGSVLKSADRQGVRPGGADLQHPGDADDEQGRRDGGGRGCMAAEGVGGGGSGMRGNSHQVHGRRPSDGNSCQQGGPGVILSTRPLGGET